MAFTEDEIEIEILEDGTIKISTDKISDANHVNAEQFIRAIAEELGADVTTTRKRTGHTHHHHSHTHKHSH